ncbi:MAG TPA: four helix bundle protein [Candidatus Saccharimonadales bacterium]|nr:four helix bundle protein [Candidatus Saccharimonadales bacterium]
MAENQKPSDIKERTFNFAVAIVRLCAGLTKQSGVSRSLSYQLLSSGTSIGANVEEAQAGQSRADFVSKYAISLKEARETIYWLRLLEASGQLSGDKLQTLQLEANEIARIIGAIIIRAKTNNGRK